MTARRTLELTLHGAAREPAPDGTDAVLLSTDRGDVACRLHAPEHGVPEHGDAAVLWVFGAGGGLGGPAGGIYARLGRVLVAEGIASLEVAYRRPGDLAECVLDTLLGVAYLGTLGRRRVVLVGHSFGGAVVITAGAMSDRVIGVAALSSQTAGTGAVAALSPRPLLLAHGAADEVLPPACSQFVYDLAGEPKRLVLLPGARHGLDEAADEVHTTVRDWIVATLRAAEGED